MKTYFIATHKSFRHLL